jgi:hypothetical protein
MTPEDELLEDLRREFPGAEIVVDPTSHEYVDVVQRRFPFLGSKIDWDRVPRSQVRRVSDVTRFMDEAVAFTLEVMASERLDREVQIAVIGDNAMDVTLRMSPSTFRRCLRTILDMPQHTYVLALDGAWCLVYTMEGDLCFGYGSP